MTPERSVSKKAYAASSVPQPWNRRSHARSTIPSIHATSLSRIAMR
jgi:hypothetical protein